MIDLITKQEMCFLATSDAQGNCDCSPRFGKPGFIHTLDSCTLAYGEIRGNGVFASLGNIKENPHAGLVFVDFFNSTVGLHVNGSAQIHHHDNLPQSLNEYLQNNPALQEQKYECWVTITIDEAYIHCSKHVPKLQKQNKKINWGTDDPKSKSTDYFDNKS